MDACNPTTDDWRVLGRIKVGQALEIRELARRARPAGAYAAGQVVIIEPRPDEYQMARVDADLGAHVQVRVLNVYREIVMEPACVHRSVVIGALE